ncbi:MAG: Ig-like domain-containing protein, partial [Phycisphaerales bacterium]
MTLTSPFDSASYVSPETIALAADATPASGRTIASVTYYGNGNLRALGGTSPFGASWSSPEPGSYSVRAVAKDDAGGMAFSPPVTVTVGPAQPPTVAITMPGSGATYTAPATVAITASATAVAGATITQVEFLRGTTVVGTATSSPFTFNWNNVAAGSYTLTARATDSRTSKATSSPVTITVGAAPSLSIAAAAGLAGSTVNETTMLVNGSIVAPPNSGVTVNGILAVVGAGGEFAANDVPLVAGANTITLAVT